MKKFLALFACLLSMATVMAQTPSPLALNVYGSYIFKDKLHFDSFTGYANEGFQYGGGLEYYFEKVRSVELKYLRQDTRFPLYGSTGKQLNDGKDKATVNYVLVSFTNYFEGASQSKVVPYTALGAGVGILDSDDGGSSAKFAWDVKLGMKLITASRISFKLQATLQSVTAAVGSDFYATSIGTVALTGYTSLFQFGLGGAMCYDF